MTVSAESNARRLVTMPTLRERGWTPSMVKKLLGEPDELRRNPYYRSAAPMRLWALARVEEVETTDEFAELRERGARRQAAGQKAAATKTARHLDDIERLRITVQRVPPAELQRRVIRSYNAMQEEREFEAAYRGHYDYDGWRATSDSSPDFLDRITVNYVRHRLTRYDEQLLSAYGRVGADDARHLLKLRVLEAIGETYPHLREECVRQAARAEAERMPAFASVR